MRGSRHAPGAAAAQDGGVPPVEPGGSSGGEAWLPAGTANRGDRRRPIGIEEEQPMKRNTSRLSRLALVLAVLGVATAAVATHQVQARGTTYTAVPFVDGRYRYLVVGHGEVPASFEAVGFDDSNWNVGDAAFGRPVDTCPWHTPSSIQSSWPSFTDLLVRKTFELPKGAHKVRVTLEVDDPAIVFVNGVQVGVGGVTSCDSTLVDLVVPDELLVTGTNLLAIRSTDDGARAYLDVQVTYDVKGRK
jgi:hypothetical protein